MIRIRHMPRHKRRALADRILIAWVGDLREWRDAAHARRRARAQRWPDLPPPVPEDVEGFPIGGKTR